MSDYSSDEEYETSPSTTVQLGYVDTPLDDDIPTLEDTFVGGTPLWFDNKPPPSNLLRCGHCSLPMALLLQAYAPFPSTLYDRIIYIFACKNTIKCSKKIGSIRAIRGINKDPASIEKIKLELGIKADNMEKKEADNMNNLFNSDSNPFDSNPFDSNPFSNPFDKSKNPFDKVDNLGKKEKSEKEKSEKEKTEKEKIEKGKIEKTEKEKTEKEKIEKGKIEKTEKEKSEKKEKTENTEKEKMDENREKTEKTYAEIANESKNTKIDKKSETMKTEKKTEIKTETNKTNSKSELDLLDYPGFFIYTEKEVLKKITLEPELEKYKSLIDENTDEEDEFSKISSGGLDPKTAKISNMLDDEIFENFSNIVKHNPSQILRYDLGGKPLFYSGRDDFGKTKGEINGKQFELQLMPKLIMDLELINHSNVGVSDILNGMSWGTIIVYTDKEDNIELEDNIGYVEEYCGVQWEESV